MVKWYFKLDCRVFEGVCYMIPLKVLTLIASPAPAPSILVLQPEEEQISPGKSRVIPIYIGVVEAMALGAALEQMRFSRPNTHDLVMDMLASLDTMVDHVLINDVKGKTFFAQLTLSQHGRLIDVDARPYDALALAIRQDAPLFVEEEVLETASYPYLFKTPLDEEQALDEFKDFLDNLSPEDFIGE